MTAAEVEEEKDNRLETLVAILIAVVTVIGAVIAWRASVAADGAGDADFAGLQASLNAEETRALNYVNAYEHYGAYVAYARYLQLGNALADDIEADPNLTDTEADRLDRERAEAYDLSDANQDLFPNRFLNRDGTYSVQREIDEAWADAAREKNFNADQSYAEANKLRAKTNQLLLTITVLGLGLICFTLIEAAGERLRLPLLVLGLILSVAGTAAAVFIEFMS